MNTVDVIVPCYRYGKYLRDCVASVLSQMDVEIRVLIIDDASPDDSALVGAALAKEDSRITFLQHTENKGHIATYNEGIEWATADYMLILSADDFLLPGALHRSVNIMDSHPEVGFTFGNVIVQSDTDIISEAVKVSDDADNAGLRILGGLDFIELSGSNNIVLTPSAVVRTKLQKRLGGYRPELPHSGDMEMWLRFAAHASVGILDAYQAVYRLHATNMHSKYFGESWLPDLQQRKAALECFFDNYSNVLPNPQQLHYKMFRSLSCLAVSKASTALNDGEIDISRKLSELAIIVFPGVTRSLPWMKLICKRYLGNKVWRTLQPSVNKFRQVSLLFKDRII